MAINDVLLLKAARRDTIANLKCFGAADTRNLISIVTFTFTMRRHLIRLASLPFISSRLATFAWVRFPCARRGQHNAEFTKGEGWVNSDPILSRLWTKVHEIFRQCRKPPVSRFVQIYSPLSLEVVEKRSKCKSFLAPNFCGRDGSDFCTALC